MKKNITIGMDLGDKKNYVFGLNEEGKKLESQFIMNTQKQIEKFFKKYEKENTRIVMETGTHSPWISEMLKKKGFEVLVVNSNQLPLISRSIRKNDMKDAELLARLGRFDKDLLHTIEHRSQESRNDLSIIKSRNKLVETRASLVNHVRGIFKSFGQSIPSSSTPSFTQKIIFDIPHKLKNAINPILEIIDTLTVKIRNYDKQIKELSEIKYPETKLLRQVNGVGPVTALTFILTIETPDKFQRSRTVGAFLGLTSKIFDSGEINKQLRISKAGNKYLRSLLITCSNYIMGPFGNDCDLRQHGLKIMQRGGKNTKKKAIVAVARKLSVLLHRLWKDKAIYDPFYNSKKDTLKQIA
ncbi:IS110 family transposase [bacterium B13(2017)]|nr:IS110 family transposase [bacterium B13(2017)]